MIMCACGLLHAGSRAPAAVFSPHSSSSFLHDDMGAGEATTRDRLLNPPCLLIPRPKSPPVSYQPFHPLSLPPISACRLTKSTDDPPLSAPTLLPTSLPIPPPRCSRLRVLRQPVSLPFSLLACTSTRNISTQQGSYCGHAAHPLPLQQSGPPHNARRQRRSALSFPSLFIAFVRRRCFPIITRGLF